MKRRQYLLLLLLLLLSGCNSNEVKGLEDVNLSSQEKRNIELARTDIDEESFYEGIDNVVGTDYEVLPTTSYDAYIYSRAVLSEDNFLRLQETQGIFTESLSYEDYLMFAEGFITKEEYEATTGSDESTNEYLEIYVLRLVQYLNVEH
ncbi:hypothetical protein DH09_11570 [Bacillaceae bacterium JMAK1]|nr:hypothetical protein DH09_11570 [Bacillaceae bacterium JMAK1]